MRIRLLALLVLSCFLVFFQIWSVEEKVPFITEERYLEEATTLREANGVRYGFIVGHHGASLVRAQVAVGASLRGEQATPVLTEVMKKIADRVPRLAAAEGLFYLTVCVFVLFAVPRLYRLISHSPSKPARRAASAGALAALTLLILLAPRSVLGYGNSAFSNWVGPCALSSSGPYLRVSGIPGETVSYRRVLEVLTLPVVSLSIDAQLVLHSLQRSFAADVVGELLHVEIPREAADGVIYWLIALGMPFLSFGAIAFVGAKWRAV